MYPILKKYLSKQVMIFYVSSDDVNFAI